MVRAEVTEGPEVVRSLIMRHYGLPVQSLEKVRAIYKIRTPYGSFGFKNAEELPDLPLVADFLEHVRHNGFERTPAFVLTTEGTYLIYHENKAFFMERWVDYPEVPKESYPYLQNIGRALADFHHAAKGVIPPKESHRYEWGKRKDMLSAALAKIRQWKQRPLNTPMEKMILDFLNYRCYLALMHLQKVSPQRLIHTSPDAAVLCHGGLHHKNILTDSRNRIWFIDFETMVYAERVMDMAQLLQYHASPYRWNPAVVNTFLTAYLSRITAPIVPEEWSIFFSYLAFPRRFYNRMIRYFDNTEHPQEFLMKLKETMDQDLDKENYLSKFHVV
ncbi:hypothetical protein SD71_02920 [Cohnella kolymensis]|uniref:Aminoglycoside phosphotransferase domain-containing protein n=1 Tax=Cohnella kolymensis TaxID=1590652 RepID=A0ABR5AA56_9BACL|nr:phosphotransferase [Cohnella kolymensis]KIL37578.1 hypothetical protein SD71_02920 [Cohnella kolymensis]